MYISHFSQIVLQRAARERGWIRSESGRHLILNEATELYEEGCRSLARPVSPTSIKINSTAMPVTLEIINDQTIAVGSKGTLKVAACNDTLI